MRHSPRRAPTCGLVGRLIFGLLLRICGQKHGPACSAKWIFSGRAPVSHGSAKARPPARFSARGPQCHGRTVGLDIPGRVASPQSPTPFLQARKGYQKRVADSSAVGHPSDALKIQEGSGDWPPGGYRGCHGWLGWLSLPMQHPEKIENYVQSRFQLTHRFSGRAFISSVTLQLRGAVSSRGKASLDWRTFQAG